MTGIHTAEPAGLPSFRRLTLRRAGRHHALSTMMPVCPKCDVGLLILKFKGIEADYCERCRGLWLDAGELETLLTNDDPLLGFQQQTGRLPHGHRHLCPRCDRSLHEIAAGALMLDRCPSGHGLWFDADELQRLLAMFPTGAGTVAYLNEIFGSTPKTMNKEEPLP